MNNYELTVILRNKDLDTLKDKVKSILEKNKVNITLDEPKGNKRLAYQIDGEKEAYYLYVKLTHYDIASLIGSTRETTTACLNEFKREGLIDFDGRRIVIINSDGLKRRSAPVAA